MSNKKRMYGKKTLSALGFVQIKNSPRDGVYRAWIKMIPQHVDSGKDFLISHSYLVYFRILQPLAAF